MEGPDQILPATSLTMTDPEGAVKFRHEETLSEAPPMSVPTMLRKTAEKYPGEEKTFIIDLRKILWHFVLPYTFPHFTQPISTLSMHNFLNPTPTNCERQLWIEVRFAI